MITPQMDGFGRFQCPGCGEYIPVVTHIDKPGDPSKHMTVIDIDFMPMAEHWVNDHPGEPRVTAGGAS